MRDSVVGPRPSVWSTAPVAWALTIGAWVVSAVVALLWVAGGVASRLAGGPPTAVALGVEFGVGLARQPVGPGKYWPGVPVALILAVWAVLVAVPVVAGALAVGWWRRRIRPTPVGLAGLAPVGRLAALAPAGVRSSARRLRPTLAGVRPGRIPGPDAGVLLGRHALAGTELRASWEDVAVAVMAPRAGKTTCQAIPAILDAPGAAVGTSNKADLWEATARWRAERGRVWVFDPQSITGVDQTWWWNPLAAVDTWEDAVRLAAHFMVGAGDEDRVRGSDPFWEASAADLLAGTFLAAALGGRSLGDVQRWIATESTEPGDILAEHGRDEVALSLAGHYGTTQITRSGIYSHAKTALGCLQNRAITRWVTPPPGTEAGDGLDEFVPGRLARSCDTIYLLSKDGATGAAPLVAALTDQIMQAAVRRAEREPAGRLDPPMTVILDEAANICRIADLPDLYSHLGSRGVFALTILQSVAQGRRVWGPAGWDTLWGAATIKVIGAGCDDDRLLDAISQAVGDTEVTVSSVTIGGPPHLSTRRQRLLPVDAIRALPKGRALLLATGHPVAGLRLQPWFESRHADRVRAGQAATRATRWLPPDPTPETEGTTR